MQYDFPKMWGGGVKGRLELFRKFIRFGTVTRPLRCMTNMSLRLPFFGNIYITLISIGVNFLKDLSIT